MSNPARAFSGALREAVLAAPRILLTGPIGPDGDSIGACLALARAIRAICGNQVVVGGSPSYRYSWMPDAAGMVPDDQLAGPFDMVVVLDGDQHRLEPHTDALFRAAACKAIIDHHGSTTDEGYDLAIVDRTAASTVQMILDILERWSVDLDSALATMLYAGLIFDTGGFRHPNTTGATHALAARLLSFGIDHSAISVRVLSERSAAGLRLLGQVIGRAQFSEDGAVVWASISQAERRSLGAQDGDLEGIVDALLYTHGVELACLCIERPNGQVKLSLRSRTRVNVAEFAQSLSQWGGGHPRAAGVLLNQSLSQTETDLPPKLIAAV